MQHTLTFDTSKPGGQFKILNGTNGGPWHKRHRTDQHRSNFVHYKNTRIPYSKNHDSGMHCKEPSRFAAALLSSKKTALTSRAV